MKVAVDQLQRSRCEAAKVDRRASERRMRQIATREMRRARFRALRMVFAN
jgi:hypothetical protein